MTDVLEGLNLGGLIGVCRKHSRILSVQAAG